MKPRTLLMLGNISLEKTSHMCVCVVCTHAYMNMYVWEWKQRPEKGIRCPPSIFYSFEAGFPP